MVMAIARQHEAKFLTENWKQIEFLKAEEDLVQERNQDKKLKTRRMLVVIPDQIACGSQNDECCSCGVFLVITINDKERLDRDGMKVWKIFDDKGCSLGLTEDL
jgi:hypothetical protein